jgi:hypothetical protein
MAALVAGVNGYLLAQGKPPPNAAPAFTMGEVAAPPPVMGMVAMPVNPAPAPAPVAPQSEYP